MPRRQRIVVSVTWTKCPKTSGLPHLGELTIFEGSGDQVDAVMRQNHYTLFKPREFICRYCRSHSRQIPTALMIVDVPEGKDYS